MAFGTELEGVASWIYSKLEANVPIKQFVGNHPEFNSPQIYLNSAPEGARLPYCVFTYLGGQSRNASSGRKILKKLKFSIQFVTAGDSVKDVMGHLGRIESLFQADQMTSDIVIIGSHLEGDFVFDEILDGGVRVTRTGILVSISAYPQNPNQL